jgi:hypothetical protein
MRQKVDKNAGNKKILSTYTEIMSIRSRELCCGKSVHITPSYAHILFAVPVFLLTALAAQETRPAQPISARLSPTKAPSRRRKSGRAMRVVVIPICHPQSTEWLFPGQLIATF